MTDGAFPDRITQLRSRWEADPTSRIFLQLAEEYRHLGRVKEALEVLEKGLKEHPGYLSALVAKGRCYIELGEPQLARGVLERVVKQDPTQMVANKLLVRACLETGEPARARERLDLYSLLNDSDPEIEDLRRRIQAAERPPQAATPEPPAPPAPPAITAPLPVEVPLPPMDAREQAPPPPPPPRVPAPPPREDLFDLGARPASRPTAGGDVFDFLAPPAPVPAPAPAPAAPLASDTEEVFQLAAPAPTAETEPELQPLAVVPTSQETYAEVEEEPEEDADGDLFPGLRSRASRQRYFAAFAAEGIFELEAPTVPGAPPQRQPVAAAPPPAQEPLEPELPPIPPAPAVTPLAERAAAPPTFLAWADAAPFAELTEPPLAEPPLEPAPVLAAEPVFAPAPVFAPEPVFEEPVLEAVPEPVFDLDSTAEMAEMEVVPEPIFEPEPLPPPAPVISPVPVIERAAEPVATVTLGDLYLRQGHPHEAERIFREVVEREPANSAARAGLEHARQQAREPRPLDAAELLAGFEPGRAPGSPNARKIFLLNSYLERLRRGRRRDVS